MKKKFFMGLMCGFTLVFAHSITVFAGTWKTGTAPNENRWRYDNDDGSYAVDGWYWLDDDNDGIAECYYFDEEGYLLVNTITPDHYQVNAEGRWVVDGVVQIQEKSSEAADDAITLYDEVMAKHNEIQDMHVTMKLDTIYNEESIWDDTRDRELKVSGLRTPEAKFLCVSEYMSAGTAHIIDTMFFTDGYLYDDKSYDGVTYKQWSTKKEMSLDEVTVFSMNGVPQPQQLTDIQVKTDGNGNKTFTFVGSSEDLFESALVLYRMGIGFNWSETVIKFAQVVYYHGTLSVDANGYITSSDIVINYDVEMPSLTSTTPARFNRDMKIETVYHNLGQPVSLTIPSVEDHYRLVDINGYNK